jgi:hypothetical protein
MDHILIMRKVCLIITTIKLGLIVIQKYLVAHPGALSHYWVRVSHRDRLGRKCLKASVLNQSNNILAPDFHGIGLEIDGAWGKDRLAGAHVKASEMQRAFDQLAVQLTLREARQAMGAAVVGRIERTVHIIDRKRWPIGALDLADGARRKLPDLAKKQ